MQSLRDPIYSILFDRLVELEGAEEAGFPAQERLEATGAMLMVFADISIALEPTRLSDRNAPKRATQTTP